MVYSYLTSLSSEWLELEREDDLGFNVLHLLVFSSVLIIDLKLWLWRKRFKEYGNLLQQKQAAFESRGVASERVICTIFGLDLNFCKLSIMLNP